MKFFKTFLSLAISLILISSFFTVSFSKETSAELLNIYADNMLFKQNEEAVICGYATPGSIISLELKDSNNKILQTSSATTSNDGTFNISFSALEGSYNEFTLIFYENSIEFCRLNNIVFGELWLASGQSNMQYPLSQAAGAIEMFESNQKLNKWLRVLLVPSFPEYKGSNSKLPSEPQNDISDAIWVNGENTSVYSMSAVAYYFAEKLMEEIDMPIGILNSSLGGSFIRTWLSRDAIDSSTEVKQYFESTDTYITLDNWDEDNQNAYSDMTGNFNQKIAPLKNFKISGMIWYQGESDLMYSNSQYDKQFDLMQKSYTDLFNYSDGLLPIIYTQLASYNYTDDGVAFSEWNISYNKIQEEQSDSRAVITIHDVSLDYLPDAGLIHPMHKREVGERMAFAASGMLYNKNECYSAPYIESFITKDDSVYITFTNTGDGLKAKGEEIYCFAIAGNDNNYVNAKAEIINNNTVRVWSELVSSPTSVTYAYGVSNQNANLYSTINGQLALPVSVFRTVNTDNYAIWYNKPWQHCDTDKIWFTEDDEYSDFYNSWSAVNATVKSDYSSGLDSAIGINISASDKKFSVSPVFSYKSGIKNTIFQDTQTDYSSYGTITFLVRNNGTEDVVFEGLRLYDNCLSWYTPAITDSLENSFTIPADGNVYYISLDLNRLYHLGNDCSLSYTNSKIDDISKIEFLFTSKSKTSDISIDSINFGPNNGSHKTGYEVDLKNADNLMEIFTGIFLALYSLIAQLFTK